MYGKHRHTFLHILKENSSVRLLYLGKSSAFKSKHTNVKFLTQFLENDDCFVYNWWNVALWYTQVRICFKKNWLSHSVIFKTLEMPGSLKGILIFIGPSVMVC